MGTATLHIDLDAIAANWRALDAASGPQTQTAAVVKADAYGLGVAPVARRLAQAGARRFFVAVAEEGPPLRAALGPGPEIAVFAGHMQGDAEAIRDAHLIPMINAPEQLARHAEALPDHPFGLQLDTAMGRLGLSPADWTAIRAALPARPWLVMSHLACADDPDHWQNTQALHAFRAMTEGMDAPRSLAATGGILLGEAFHFDMTRPGIGLYGGAPFTAAQPVVRLSAPVIQCRDRAPGETVGYGATWQAAAPARIATLSAGYADGLIRAMSNRAALWSDGTPCPLAGRVSMDLLTVDVTALDDDPESLDLLGPHQGVDALAEAAGTIGYEILTSLGGRYRRVHHGAAA